MFKDILTFKKLTVIMDTKLRRELEVNRDLRFSSALRAAMCMPANLVSACLDRGDDNTLWRWRKVLFGKEFSGDYEHCKMKDSFEQTARVEGVVSYCKYGAEMAVLVRVSFFPKGKGASIWQYEQCFYLCHKYE